MRGDTVPGCMTQEGISTTLEAMTQKEITQKGMTQEDVTQKDMTHEDMTQKDMAQKDVTQKGITHEDMTQKKMTHEDMMQKGMTHGDTRKKGTKTEDMTQKGTPPEGHHNVKTLNDVVSRHSSNCFVPCPSALCNSATADTSTVHCDAKDCDADETPTTTYSLECSQKASLDYDYSHCLPMAHSTMGSLAGKAVLWSTESEQDTFNVVSAAHPKVTQPSKALRRTTKIQSKPGRKIVKNRPKGVTTCKESNHVPERRKNKVKHTSSRTSELTSKTFDLTKQRTSPST